MAKASELIKVLQSWVGKKEKDGSHKVIIDIYNGRKPLPRNYKVTYKDSWCATAMGALAIQCNATDIIPIECSCGEMIKLAQKMGIWVENENRVPAVGEIILYDWDDKTNFAATDNTGWPEHVGMVEKVVGNKITVIEGNISDAVGCRTIDVNGRYIRGYIVPKYEAEVAPAPQPAPEKDLLKVDGEWGRDTTTKTQVVFGTIVDGEVSHQDSDCKPYLDNCLTASWEFDSTGKGSQLIRAIQTFLAKLGYYKGKIDGLCGKQTVMAIQAFLADLGLYSGKIDGEMGPKTVTGWQTYINGRL